MEHDEAQPASAAPTDTSILADEPLDEDFSVVQRARRVRRVVRAMAVTFALPMWVATLGAVALAVGSGEPSGYAVMFAVGVFASLVTADLRAADRDARSALRFEGAADGRVAIRREGPGPTDIVLEVHHPTLTVPMAVPLANVRASCVDHALDPVVERGRHRYRVFPIRRRPGALHLAYEPDAFVVSTDARHNKTGVDLVHPSLSFRLPNVALVFEEAVTIEVAAPRWATEAGWSPRPPVTDVVFAQRSMSGEGEMVARAPRRCLAPGLYLRVLRPWALAAALGGLSVRDHLTCDDWAHVTRAPHPPPPSADAT